MTDFNPYDTLGVPRDADEAAIRRGYRHRAKQTHPDAGGDATEFAAATRALAILTDPQKRREYDRTGRVDDPEPDNARARALHQIELFIENAIVKYINGNMTGPDPCTADLVAAFRLKMAADIRALNENIAVGNRVLKWLRKIQGRFSTKDEVDVIRRGFDVRIRRCEQQIEEQKDAIKIRDDALAIIKSYKFQADVQTGLYKPPWTFEVG
jgi:curved DNA-binding protein CbpA